MIYTNRKDNYEDATPTIPPNMVTFYSQANYTGSYISMGSGEYLKLNPIRNYDSFTPNV